MNETDGKTLTCGLLAHPAGHTLSPLIHNSLAEMTGKNLVYVPFDVEPENIGSAVNGALALNILGMVICIGCCGFLGAANLVLGLRRGVLHPLIILCVTL